MAKSIQKHVESMKRKTIAVDRMRKKVINREKRLKEVACLIRKVVFAVGSDREAVKALRHFSARNWK